MIHRRVRGAGARGPSPSLRRWLLSEPSALASRSASSAEVDIIDAEAGAPWSLTPAVRRPTSAHGPWPAASAPWSAPLSAFPSASGWTVQRREHKRGLWSGRREIGTAEPPSVTV
jgi:hypothetical protein